MWLMPDVVKSRALDLDFEGKSQIKVGLGNTKYHAINAANARQWFMITWKKVNSETHNLYLPVHDFNPDPEV